MPSQTEKWKAGKTLFYRNLPAIAGELSAVDWHLKVKDAEYDVGLTKTYNITVSMHKIGSIHKLILKIQQILGSHELNDHAHPKITEIFSAFLNFRQYAKNQFIPLVHS